MMEAYWKKAVSFNTYLEMIQKKAEPSDEISLNNDITNKYKSALTKADHITKNYIPNTEQQGILNKKQFKGKILIIAEGWCGDCSQSVPVINKFFKDKNAVKILYRDENPDLMKLFLTNGNEAVPTIIILDEKNDIAVQWGPRTKSGTEFLLKYKKDPENYPKEVFLSDLHEYYDRNKGFDIIDEIVSLL